jgi:hypothetical protein
LDRRCIIHSRNDVAAFGTAGGKGGGSIIFSVGLDEADSAIELKFMGISVLKSECGDDLGESDEHEFGECNGDVRVTTLGTLPRRERLFTRTRVGFSRVLCCFRYCTDIM